MKLELKHLAPYLPYQLMVLNIKTDKLMRLSSISSLGFLNEKDYQFGVAPFGVDTIKPLLRPLSSMTKEEAKEFMVLALSYCAKGDSTLLDFEIKTDKVSGTTISCLISDVMFNHIHTTNTYSICVCGDFIKIMDKETGRAISVNYSLYEWLFKNHFDVFGLIDKGLAEEKTL